ncbi:MAG: hypothetical protein OXR62_10830 [Ahrensia sp.]|nr:hypothetical protein [Ahrensia sp.]
MHRVNGAHTVDIGAGKDGFRDRNTAAGVPGTELTASWHNDVQENIAHVIEEAGIALNEGQWTLLYDALLQHIQDYLLNVSISTDEVAGLLGGGDLSQDRDFSIHPASTGQRGTMKLATQAQVDAGVADDVAVTPATLKAVARVTVQKTGNAVAVPDGTWTTVSMVGGTVLAESAALHGVGFKAGAVDAGYWHAHVSVSYSVSATIATFGVRLLIDGVVWREKRQYYDPASRAAEDFLITFNAGVDAVIEVQILQSSSPATTRTINAGIVFDRMSGY